MIKDADKALKTAKKLRGKEINRKTSSTVQSHVRVTIALAQAWGFDLCLSLRSHNDNDSVSIGNRRLDKNAR